MTFLLLESNANPALEFTTDLFLAYIFLFFIYFFATELCFCRKRQMRCVAEPCKRTDYGHYSDFGRQFFEALLNSYSFMELAILPIY